MIAVEGIPLLSTTKILRPLDPFFDADPKAKDMLMNDTHELLRNIRTTICLRRRGGSALTTFPVCSAISA